MEYIAFEHNNAAAELVKLAYDTPPLAFVHSYGCQHTILISTISMYCWLTNLSSTPIIMIS